MDQAVKMKRGKGCLIVILSVIVAFVVLVIVLANVFGGGTHTVPKQTELAKVMELNAEQEEAVLSIFEKCGIGELASVKLFNTGEDRTSYYVDDKETAAYSGANHTIIVWVDNATKAVQEIYFNDVTIYEDGTVKARVSDYYIAEDARSTYRTSAQILVNKCLSYPETAKYKSISGWSFGVLDGFDCVQSTVTAKNALGVENTMQFTVKYDRATGTPISLVLDGKEYIQ